MVLRLMSIKVYRTSEPWQKVNMMRMLTTLNLFIMTLSCRERESDLGEKKNRKN